jgi:hypothetical protein
VIEKGQRAPNWSLEDIGGQSHDLWDYRQKSHLLLLYEPEAPPAKVGRWQAAILADQKQWDWLEARVIIVKKAPKDVVPGVYVIDRYGMFWNYFSPGHWTFDDLERDLIYYEARHC